MKKIVLAIISYVILIGVNAQTPNTFKYQAVLRNAEGYVSVSESVTIDILILQGGETGTEVFSESHNVTSNEQGVISLEIGSLLNGTGTIESIDWSTGVYFVQISLNGTVMGTSQLLSVPFAMHANSASQLIGEFDYSNLTNKPDFSAWDQDASDDFDGDYNSLTNLPELFDGDYSSLINAPQTITEEQRSKLDSITLTSAVDLNQIKADVETNNAKISFPGFGSTEATALRGDTPLWSYYYNSLYYTGKVVVNKDATTIPTYREALYVDGGATFNGGSNIAYPGVLFYSPNGDGSFRYYNNNLEERILGSDTVVVDTSTEKDQLAQDLIVIGSLCVGQDGVNGEAFGFNTIHLKENNLRILFDDTDTPESGYPYYDWVLEANDTKSGGDNYFAIVNKTANTVPFKIMPGASDNSFYISENGDVGIGTNSPEAKLDVKGEIKADAFIGDGSALTGITGATGGIDNVDSTFIKADTDENSVGSIALQTQNQTRMFITNEGNVGIGTTSPSANLEVEGLTKLDTLVVENSIQLEKKFYDYYRESTEIDSVEYNVGNKSLIGISTFDYLEGDNVITGFFNGVEGQEITIINTSSRIVRFKHNDAGTQKILLPNSTDIELPSNSSARFVFDGSFWYCIGHFSI